MKYIGMSFFWITNFGFPDLSFGVHVCMKGRIDIHFLIWMVSIGRVPIYENKGKKFAVSNSYHSDKRKSIRAGTP